MSEAPDRLVADRKGARAAGVLLVALGIFLLVSLVTYSPFDPPNSSQVREGTYNWAGRIGAEFSYWAIAAIGRSAFLLPVLALLWGWNRLYLRPWRGDAVRSVGLLGLALFFSIGAGLPAYSPHLAFYYGGWLGQQSTSVLLIPYAGRIGSTIFLLALLIASLMLSTEVDPRRAMGALRYVGRALARLWAGLCAAAGRVARLRPSLPRRAPPRAAEDQAADEPEPEEDHEEEGDEGEWEETPAPVASLPTIGARSSEPAATEATATSDGDSSDDMPTHVGEDMPEPEPPAAVAEKVVEPPRKRRPRPAPAADGGAADKGAAAKPAGNGAAPADANGARRGKPASGKYRMPGVNLLDEAPPHQGDLERDALLENARMLEEALNNFDVSGRVVEVSPGPVVTRYEVEPAAGVKVNRFVALSDDLARVMSAQGIRIQAPVPGKSVVGVEIANHNRETVYLREIIESSAFKKMKSPLAMALGKTISGDPHVADLARMPHLLVAGATGSGKSVCINSLISSILYKVPPDKVRLLMVDPKLVELTVYNDIPHLLVPVVTDPKKASEALKWAVAEMESRYQLLARLGVRNLDDYNRKVDKLKSQPPEEDTGEEFRSLPYIVIIIDEFADLMLTAPADVETSLMGLAQKSRAVGIHIILATQRPSVNVITGVIKANFPSRIAFQVASKTDSRTILDMNGAERLLGRGDMLFLPGGQGEPIRVHGAFISGEETERLVEAIKSAKYEAEEVAVFEERADISSSGGDRDELFDEAVDIVVEHEQASTSFLQRRMKVGYSRAARLMDELEAAGIVGPAEGAKPREILIDTEPAGANMDGDGEDETDEP